MPIEIDENDTMKDIVEKIRNSYKPPMGYLEPIAEISPYEECSEDDEPISLYKS